MNLIAILSLFVAATVACGSTCICQHQDGTFDCLAKVKFPWREHDCAGFCRDRTCAGMTPGPNPVKCRVWKGFCDLHGSDYHSGLGGFYLEYCDDKHHAHNDCEKDFDCPAPKQ